MKKSIVFMWVLVVTMVTFLHVFVGAADVISIQGVLKDPDGIPLAGGFYGMRFDLYDVEKMGTSLWMEAHTNSSSVKVAQGHYSVTLGAITPFPKDFFLNHENLWLEVSVDIDDNGTFDPSETFLPRVMLCSTVCSQVAKTVEPPLIMTAPVDSENAVISGTNTASQPGVYGEHQSSGNFGELGTKDEGVYGSSANGNGVYGSSLSGNGVHGSSASGYAVHGYNTSGNEAYLGGPDYAVYGTSSGQAIYGENTNGTFGLLGGTLFGVRGESDSVGVIGASSADKGWGVSGTHAVSNNFGILGTADYGVYGEVDNVFDYAVYGKNKEYGNYGYIGSGESDTQLHHGVYGVGVDPSGVGVFGKSEYNGAFGMLGLDVGGYLTPVGVGIYAHGNGAMGGIFVGDVEIIGDLSKSSGSFKIDHPLDPANKYLYHSFVESPDMMNIYNGNVVLNGKGEAWIDMPEWFQPLNRDFRYQLTPIGAPMPDLYIAREIEGSRFKIGGGAPDMKVSWQVTGIRQDPYAEAHRICVEEEKPDDEKGYYLHPEIYGQPSEKNVYSETRLVNKKKS